jgi:DHA2 family multidrug resistance protein
MLNILRMPFQTAGRPSHHPILAVCAVLLGPFMVGFHSRLFGVGMVDLRAAFGLGVDEASWLNTLATAPQIVLAPAVAWLAAAYGIRRVMILPALLYGALSLIIPMTRDFQLLAVFHVVHGALLGVFVPATLMIIFRNLPVQWWISAIAIYAFRGAFTGNAGTALVDFYVQHLGWQWLYWQDVILAPLVAAFAFFGAPRENVNQDLVHRADWGGMILLGSGLSLMFMALDQGNRLDWFESGFVISAFVGGLVLLVAFFANEALVQHPWASIGAIGKQDVVLLLTVALFYLMSSLSNTTLIPNYLTAVAQLRPEQIAVTLLYWVCIPLIIMTPVTVWALHRIDGRWLILAGLCCFAGAALIGTTLTSEWSGENFRTMAVLQGAGHILTFLPIIVLTVAHGDPKRAIAVAAYIQVIRLLGGETAQTLMGTYIRKGEQLHSYLSGLHLEKGSDATVATLSTIVQKLASAGQVAAQNRAMALLSQQVQKQANVLSYIDAFWLTFYCAVAGLVILAFVHKAPKGPLTSI